MNISSPAFVFPGRYSPRPAGAVSTTPDPCALPAHVTTVPPIANGMKQYDAQNNLIGGWNSEIERLQWMTIHSQCQTPPRYGLPVRDQGPDSPGNPSHSCVYPAHVTAQRSLILGGPTQLDARGNIIGGWNNRTERAMWIIANPTCPTPAPYCDQLPYPPRPVTQAEYSDYVTRNPGCSPPPLPNNPSVPNPMPVPVPGTVPPIVPVPAPSPVPTTASSAAPTFWQQYAEPALILGLIAGAWWLGKKSG
jgi:hypothetical protein